MFLILTDLNDTLVRINVNKILVYQGTPTGGTKLHLSTSDSLYFKESVEMVDATLRELYLTVHRRANPQ